MIALQPERLQPLEAQLRESIEEFERVLYIVTNRMQIHIGRGEMQPRGTVVCLMSLGGKIELIAAELRRRAPGRVKDAEARYNELASAWRNFAGEFSEQIKTELQAQFDEVVLHAYATTWETREILLEPSDFDCFRDERDWIECFLLGCDSEARDRFWKRLTPIEQRAKEYVYETVRPHLSEKWPAAIPNGNVEWAPREFWWRHL
jgi:hypothetical protein